jgi:demethylspheroidene O-methyltransferase
LELAPVDAIEMPVSPVPVLPEARAPGDQFGAKRSLGDRSFALRNRLLASPRFQRWASRSPLTRRFAQRRAQDLFDLCAGFVYSQVLQACVQLRLFDALIGGPQSLEELGTQLSLPPQAAARLLEAAIALDLVERRRDGRFGLGVLGAALVGNPAVSAMIEHHPRLYADLRDPVALLQGEQDTALARLWPYAREAQPTRLGASEIDAYTTLMAASQPLVAHDVLSAYRLDRHRCLLDLGGGDGSFLIEATAMAPDLKLVLFDLPAVAERARENLANAGLADRTEIVGGDFRVDPLPEGADVISLVRVIHDHDDDVAMAILSAAWNALPAGGTLLLAEPTAGTPNAERVGAYFAFYLLAMGSGRPRRTDELAVLLHSAGFTSVRILPTRRPMLVRVLTASK